MSFDHQSPPRVYRPPSTYLATPPRNSIVSTTPNTSPSPRVPLGRSPQKVAFATNSQAHDSNGGSSSGVDPAAGDTMSRTSIDSSAIFSIYSMYGSECGGSAPVPALPPMRTPGGSQAPSRVSLSSSHGVSASHTSTPSDNARNSVLGHQSHERQKQQDLAFHHHHQQQQRQRQLDQADRTPSLPASSSQALSVDGDGELGLGTSFAISAAANPHPPSSYNFTTAGVNGNSRVSQHRSSLSSTSQYSTSNHHGKVPSIDDEDDDGESFGMDIEFSSRHTMSSTSSLSKPNHKRSTLKSTTSTSSGRSRSELPYFDTGVMPSVPPPHRPPSAASISGNRPPSTLGVNGGPEIEDVGSRRSPRFNGDDGAHQAASHYNGMDGNMNGKTNNRMSMSNWLPDPTFTAGRLAIPTNLVTPPAPNGDSDGANGMNGASHRHSGLYRQSVAPPSSESECQPPALSGGPLPAPVPLQHSRSAASNHSHTSSTSSLSVYATPLTAVSPNAATVLGSPTVGAAAARRESKRSGSTDSKESGVAMFAGNNTNNGSSALRYHTASLSSSRRGSPAPSLQAPAPHPPPSSFSANNNAQYPNPGSRRQTPSPAPSRAGSLATPSINFPPSHPSSSSLRAMGMEPQESGGNRYYGHHSPHSSLSRDSTHSHQSYGGSSVITKDTMVSAISGTTATSSGTGVEQSVPPPPLPGSGYQFQQSTGGVSSASGVGGAGGGSVYPLSPLGRASLQGSSSQHHGHQHRQSSASSSGGGIPRFDKDLPDIVGGGGGGSRRPSPVPSLSVNGSPHHSIHMNGGGSRESGVPRQSRLGQASSALSPSISQQSNGTTTTTATTTTTTSSISVTVSSTGATTANSSPNPSDVMSTPPFASTGVMMNSSSPRPDSLTPHRSSSSMRNGSRVNGSPHQSVASTGHQQQRLTGISGGGGSSIKAHSMASLVPSVGEDLDAFHVRNTYAQLEVSGVKGDGYEEGVERTRAARTRVASSVNNSPNTSGGGADTSGSVEDGNSSGSHSRPQRTKSQMLADAAVADENEKKRELDPKEIQVLGSLDRYGFFSVPSHDRLMLLPSQPLLKPLPFSPAAAASVSASAPPPSPTQASGNASATPKTLSALPVVLTPPKESARIAKWGRMLIPHERDEGGNVQGWRVRPNKAGKLRRRAYKGIPDRWRAAAWEVLMTAYSSAATGGDDGRGRAYVGSVPVETTLRQTTSTSAVSGGVREVQMTERQYRDCLEKPSEYDIQIDLDVPRTISGHIMFRTRYGAGQRSLFHVLHSFSLRCETCGYVQGMGPIAACLLSYMSPSLAYTSLVRLHDAYELHTVFSPGFPGLLEAIYVQECLTKATMPGVYAAFQKHMISTTSYATKWYITLFANSVPFQTQLRLWDVFLLEGYDVFIAVALAIVWVYRDHITSAAANFETVLSLLSGFFVPEDEDQLLGWIEKLLGDARVRSAMRGWRSEWRELVKQGKEGTALL